ncbi:hypothetical protein KFK09_017381 [Dendrobium nobile]|uniref:Uncharacterized protein n=1 Tax=Dendrobium nobile TaxID=94219 RepID=A0A8T3B399_DENNO|nr:hypothetical protein KFK09_017381 [Dendrobium nobile]
MRPESSLSSSVGVRPWQCPAPYLFGGLAAMIMLIAIALMVLACYQHKSQVGESRTPAIQPEKPAIFLTEVEPRVVVIMAGDELPTFFAKPLSPVLLPH